jgi:hypothetical protein
VRVAEQEENSGFPGPGRGPDFPKVNGDVTVTSNQHTVRALKITVQ